MTWQTASQELVADCYAAAGQPLQFKPLSNEMLRSLHCATAQPKCCVFILQATASQSQTPTMKGVWCSPYAARSSARETAAPLATTPQAATSGYGALPSRSAAEIACCQVYASSCHGLHLSIGAQAIARNMHPGCSPSKVC